MKKSKKKKISNILFYVVMLVVVGINGFFVYEAIRIHKLNTFNEEEWQYMYSYIENEFGDGEKFHIISKDTEIIKEFVMQRAYPDGTLRDDYKILGVKASFIGYFDSQENLYAVSFAKYLEDNKLYKNGKAGTIICIAVANNYSKDEYLKGMDK